MMRKIVLLIICVALVSPTLADRLDSLYNAIDDGIVHAHEYAAKKEQLLSSLHQETVQARDLESRYQATMRLYEAYRSFRNDSAIACLNRCILMADSMGRADLKAVCYNKIGLQHSVSGFYSEAMNYLSQIPRKELKGEVLTDYYYAMNHLYGEMASYTQDNNLKWKYYKHSSDYRDSLLNEIPHDTEVYLGCQESQLYNNHNYEAALKVNDQRMRLARPETRNYAIVTYFRAMDYGGLGQKEEQKYWLAQSALCDIKNCVMDQASLWSLAAILNEEGDIQRSYRYVEYSWACTSHFSAHVRSWLVSPVLTMINDNYKEKLNHANTRLWFLVAAVSLLALLMAAMYLYVSRKRKQLAVARNELKASNDRLALQSQELSKANTYLSSLNAQLSTLNSQLSESNRVKEEYIGKFFSLCSEYIDKLDQFRIKVNRKVKAKQFEDLYRLSQNEQMKEDEVAVLFANFDSIFLHIFPNFMDDFNALLKPEYQIQQTEKGKLPTDARIFALIRLGIEDSSKIAEFLHYSPNTIYNYRARLKSKAIDRENFEEQVKAINCTPLTTEV